jgi:hypothetical protein
MITLKGIKTYEQLNEVIEEMNKSRLRMRHKKTCRLVMEFRPKVYGLPEGKSIYDYPDTTFTEYTYDNEKEGRSIIEHMWKHMEIITEEQHDKDMGYE